MLALHESRVFFEGLVLVNRGRIVTVVTAYAVLKERLLGFNLERSRTLSHRGMADVRSLVRV
jgi:hypothetical protein